MPEGRMISRLPSLMVAAGAVLFSLGLASLLSAGLLWLNDAGLGGWLGWFNLSVLCGGWWLAWTWTRPGTVLPAANWTPLPHFSNKDNLLWDRARQAITDRSADLAAAETPAAWFAIVREIFEHLQGAGGVADTVQWREKTLSELMSALHAGQVLLRRRVECLLGHLLLPRIDRWELVWRSGVLLDKYGLVAWIPGLIFSPLDSLARYLAGLVLRSPAARGIKRDSSRILWELLLRDLAVVLVDFNAGRLKGSGSRYVGMLESVDSGKIGFRLLRPAVLACTQALPLIVMGAAGLFYLFSFHWVSAITCVLVIMLGSVLLVIGGRIWLFPPETASTGNIDAGRRAIEKMISESGLEHDFRLHDMSYWLQMAEKLDRDVGLAVTRSGSGWRGRSIGELLRGIESACRDLEHLVRQAVPGSRHIRLGDWLKAGGWMGWLGRVTSGGNSLMSAVPSRGGITGMALSWLASKVAKKADDYLRQVMIRAVARRTGNFLIELHSGRWRNPSNNEVPNDLEEPKPILLIIGSAGAGCTTVANGLRDLPEMNGWEIIETSSLWSVESGSRGISQVVETVRQADAVVLLVRAVGAARDPEIRFLDRWNEAGQGEVVASPLLGLLAAVDLVSPPLEWNPPYDLSHGTSRKEISMRACVEAARNCFGERVTDWRVTGCREGLWWGLREDVVPWLEMSLERARGIQLAKEMALEDEKVDWLEPARQMGRGFQGLATFFRSGWKKGEPSA